MEEEVEHYESHVVQNELLHTVVGSERLYVVHEPEPEERFLYGCAFDESGEIVAQQFEKGQERLHFLHDGRGLEAV